MFHFFAGKTSILGVLGQIVLSLVERAFQWEQEVSAFQTKPKCWVVTDNLFKRKCALPVFLFVMVRRLNWKSRNEFSCLACNRKHLGISFDVSRFGAMMGIKMSSWKFWVKLLKIFWKIIQGISFWSLNSDLLRIG